MTRPFDSDSTPSSSPARSASASTREASAPSREAAAGLYREILERVGARVSLFVRRGFFEPLVPVALDGATLTLAAPSAFHRDWVRDHYLGEIVAEGRGILGTALEVVVVDDPASAELALAGDPEPSPPSVASAPEAPSLPPRGAAPSFAPPSSSMTAPAAPSSVVSLEARRQARAPAASSDSSSTSASLNPAHTFETFVCGPSNKMAFASCAAVADAPGQVYSPLFLFGKTGLGKTHLLHAIGNAAKAQNPRLRVLYMSAEQWVNEYIAEIRAQRFDAFRKRYRGGCDLLLIDDIQFLAGKDASQDEFFHTFNSLHQSGRQIVVTSDRYPHEIEGLEHRLQTRLGWGLIADIQPPEIETRVAILERKAQSLGIRVPEEVVHFIADHVRTSVRALEGALVRLSAYANVTHSALDLEVAKEVLRPVLGRRDDISLDRIVDVVAGYYDLKPAELKGKSRQRRVTLARQLAMYLARKHLQSSLPEIGRYFGRDHTTVLSSVRKVAGMFATDAGTQAVLARLERDLV